MFLTEYRVEASRGVVSFYAAQVADAVIEADNSLFLTTMS
jgi:hypothetical protein